MIIVTQSNSYREEYILPVRRVPSESEFLARAKVRPVSYAGRLVSRLYGRLFRLSLELKRDYAVYYRLEYAAFADYLRRRHLLSAKDADALSLREASAAAIIRFRQPYYFMSEGCGEEMLNELLDVED
jgi:hypothetical protein